jgi:eukaryotic-like serine/threonine-protein kinase
MTPDRWERIQEVLGEAARRPPAERSAFLDEACGSDAPLREEVASLLESHERAGGFLESPALGTTVEAPLRMGTRLGPYEIKGLLGAGGMGEVYRAHDNRLSREVAVKVLPRGLAENPARQKRFEQEARAASALNHPNIVAVYDAGWHEGTPFMVTELLDGQSLADRIAQGPMPVRKALECGIQAARGLSAAHERGIVHRDLKPANLFLSQQGQIKILDFGIAKLTPILDGDGSRARDDAGTAPGLILGTVGYMSPEQVRGEPVDARSDQFSLGCVLYELLTGLPPFRRPSAAQTMAAVLEAEPPTLSEVNARVPRQVSWIVERCLAKDPGDRYGATSDLARDLELAQSRLSELSTPAVAAPSQRRLARNALAGLVGIAVGAGAMASAWWWMRAAPPTVPIVRYLTYSGRDSYPAAAADGKTIAFGSWRDGRHRIWLKQLATGSEVPLTEGEDDHPRFSPDGSTVLFVRRDGSRTSLYRVASVGGEPRKLVDDALYGDFSPDGRRIVFVRQSADPKGMTTVVATAQADGSSVRELARMDATHFPAGAFVQPRWSPDGRSIAATQSTLQLGEPTVMALIDAESGAMRQISPPTEAGVWRGGLAWSRPGEVLCAQPESVVGQQTGTSSRVVSMDIASRRTQLLLWSPVNIVGLDVLGPGRLVLAARSLRQNLREIPLRPGNQEGERWLTHGNGADRQPVYAKDGEWMAFSSNRSGNLDIWAVSRYSGAVRRLTDDPAHDSDPGFMPDGRLLWSSNRSGRFEIWMAASDGSGAHQVTRDGVDAENPVASPDGQWIVYGSANPRTRGIMKIRPDGTDATLVVPGNRIEPEISPDGKYVAFVADEGSDRAALRVASLADGSAVAFEVPLPNWIPSARIDQGRCRWLPDRGGLAYVAQEPEGQHVIYVQEFTPGTDTRARRRRLAGYEPDLDAESLGVSPDGAYLTISFREQLYDLMLAENVAGLEHGRSAYVR